MMISKCSLILFALIFGSCGRQPKIPNQYRSWYSVYNCGDTLVFQNEIGSDLDTVVIQAIDSFGWASNLSNNYDYRIMVKIKYLPVNNWDDGVEFVNGGRRSIFHTLIGFDIHLENEAENTVEFKYRDFSCVFIGNWPSFNDTLLIRGNLEKVAVINCLNNRNASDSGAVFEIFWSQTKGLIGYSKQGVGKLLRIN